MQLVLKMKKLHFENYQINYHTYYLYFELGIGPEILVAICLERSIEMIVSIIGLLKCGAAYVPIDPQYPIERQQFMLQNSSPYYITT